MRCWTALSLGVLRLLLTICSEDCLCCGMLAQADNKPVIVGYGLGAAAAILTVSRFCQLALTACTDGTKHQ